MLRLALQVTGLLCQDFGRYFRIALELPFSRSPRNPGLWRSRLGRLASRFDASELAAARNPVGAMPLLPFSLPLVVSIGHLSPPLWQCSHE